LNSVSFLYSDIYDFNYLIFYVSFRSKHANKPDSYINPNRSKDYILSIFAKSIIYEGIKLPNPPNINNIPTPVDLK
jgi:hypothetical protein